MKDRDQHTARRCTLTVIGAIALIVLAYLLTLYDPQVNSNPAAMPGASPAEDLAIVPRGEPSAALSRPQRTSGSKCTIRVTSAAGPHLSGASITAAGSGDSVVRDAESAIDLIGLTGADGQFEMELEAGGPDHVIIKARDHFPLKLGPLLPGRHYDAVLALTSEISIRVVTPDGRPVAGFGVAVASEPGGRNAQSNAIKLADNSGIVLSGVRQTTCATTNGNGLAILRVPRGKYRADWNTTRAPLFIHRPEALVRIESPGDYEVTVSTMLIGAAFFSGDDLIGYRLHPGRFISDHHNAQTRSLLLESLVHRFPGAIVACEAPGVEAGHEALARVYVFARRSGWSLHDIPLVPADIMITPTTIRLEPGPAVLTSRLHVKVANPDGEYLSLDPGDLMCVQSAMGNRVSIDLSTTDDYVEVPAGEITIIQGPSGLRLPRFEPLIVRTQPGDSGSVDIRLEFYLHRGRLAFLTANGDEPGFGSISYGQRESMRTRIAANGTTVSGWFVGDTVFYRANFGGRQYDGSIAVDMTMSANAVQEWKVLIE